MGAGVAWEQTNTNTISVKIGGPFSSTRPELAAIALALQRHQDAGFTSGQRGGSAEAKMVA